MLTLDIPLQSSSQDSVLLLPRAWIPPGSAAKILQTPPPKSWHLFFSMYVFMLIDAFEYFRRDVTCLIIYEK